MLPQLPECVNSSRHIPLTLLMRHGGRTARVCGSRDRNFERLPVAECRINGCADQLADPILNIQLVESLEVTKK